MSTSRQEARNRVEEYADARENKEMASWLRQSRAVGYPMRSLRPFSRRVPYCRGAVTAVP
jgi:hypothetical protein